MTDAFERAVSRDTGRRRSRARSFARGGLVIHAYVYVAVNAMLALIWWFTGGDGSGALPWVVYPVVFWGIGLGAHYLAVRLSFPTRSG